MESHGCSRELRAVCLVLLLADGDDGGVACLRLVLELRAVCKCLCKVACICLDVHIAEQPGAAPLSPIGCKTSNFELLVHRLLLQCVIESLLAKEGELLNSTPILGIDVVELFPKIGSHHGRFSEDGEGAKEAPSGLCQRLQLAVLEGVPLDCRVLPVPDRPFRSADEACVKLCGARVKEVLDAAALEGQLAVKEVLPLAAGSPGQLSQVAMGQLREAAANLLVRCQPVEGDSACTSGHAAPIHVGNFDEDRKVVGAAIVAVKDRDAGATRHVNAWTDGKVGLGRSPPVIEGGSSGRKGHDCPALSVKDLPKRWCTQVGCSVACGACQSDVPVSHDEMHLACRDRWQAQHCGHPLFMI